MIFSVLWQMPSVCISFFLGCNPRIKSSSICTIDDHSQQWVIRGSNFLINLFSRELINPGLSLIAVGAFGRKNGCHHYSEIVINFTVKAAVKTEQSPFGDELKLSSRGHSIAVVNLVLGVTTMVKWHV